MKADVIVPYMWQMVFAYVKVHITFLCISVVFHMTLMAIIKIRCNMTSSSFDTEAYCIINSTTVFISSRQLKQCRA